MQLTRVNGELTQWFNVGSEPSYGDLKGPPIFSVIFSNSLIIHKPKTKEIITMKEVWTCGLNEHKISPTLIPNIS